MISNTLLWLWQFPQNLVGVLVRYFTRARKVGDHYEYDIRCGSVSLGDYVFLCPAHWNDENTLKHEKGHSVQSRYLGWLYPLVIGFPSLIWCGLFKGYRRKHGISYYAFYTEKNADKLGGVER